MMERITETPPFLGSQYTQQHNYLITMGVSDGAKLLQPGNPSLITRYSIRKDIISKFLTKGPHSFVGIDVSIDISI